MQPPSLHTRHQVFWICPVRVLHYYTRIARSLGLVLLDFLDVAEHPDGEPVCLLGQPLRQTQRYHRRTAPPLSRGEHDRYTQGRCGSPSELLDCL